MVEYQGSTATYSRFHFGRKPDLTPEKVAEIKALRADGTTVPDIIRRVGLSKATIYRALAA